MDQHTLLDLWKSQNQQLAQNLALNKQLTEDITRIKIQSLLASMQPIKLFALVVGVAWVGIGAAVIVHLWVFALEQVSLFFLFSATIQVLLTAVALVVYLYQLVLIRQVDLSEPILDTHERLARLKTSTLWVARILFLQLPVWTTFHLSVQVLQNASWFFYLVQGSITILFVCLAIWLFVNIRYENRHQRWFRLLFQGKEWQPLMQSMDLLAQIEAYRTTDEAEQAAR